MSQQIYFGVKKTQKFFLDEGKTQFIEYKKLPEGERARFEDSVGSKIQMNQETKMMQIDNKAGSERRALVLASVIGFTVLYGDNGEQKTGDAEAFKALYDEMDSDQAAKLYDDILVFNGYKKKEQAS